MNRNCLSIVSFLLFFLFLLSCTTEEQVIIKTSSDELHLFVEIADTIEERAFGLMHRTALEKNHGMLFVFEDMQQRIFWMKNTKIPLDIIFIDASGKIVDIKENFEPCVVDNCEKYYSKPTMYALEVNAGFVEEHSIVVENTVEFRNV